VLILLRHGQTASNAAGLLLGRGDPPLTELGRRQAEALAKVDGVAGATRVVTSPLARTRETAELLGPAITFDERWIEIDYGIYDGTPLGDVPAEVWSKWRADPSWAPPGGESLTEVGQRVRAACEEFVASGEAAAADIVVVSHVSPIKAAVAWALGVGDEVVWRMFLDVASICRIGIGPRGASLRSYNERGAEVPMLRTTQG
jgi:broad specificity phosphatase PhoE